jgi:hypothetical protein
MEERIKIHCVCGKVGLVERKHIGKTITCPKCGVARIKIEDPHDSPTDEDEVQPLDTPVVPRRNQRAEIPPLTDIAPAATSSKSRHWQLTAICCLLAIIAGIMVYNQYDEWQREQKVRESKAWKEKLKSALRISAYTSEETLRQEKIRLDSQEAVRRPRTENDMDLSSKCAPSKITNVSANDFLAFVKDQADESEFRSCFFSAAEYSEEELADPEDFVKTMKNSGDLFLRWAFVNGGVTEMEIREASYIAIGWRTIRFSRDDLSTIRAFRFEVDISDLFPIDDWWDSDAGLRTFGACRDSNYLSERIDNWTELHQNLAK